VATALDLAESCPCADGCPGCILDPKCKEHNMVVSKPAAVLLLRGVLASLKPLPGEQAGPGAGGGGADRQPILPPPAAGGWIRTDDWQRARQAMIGAPAPTPAPTMPTAGAGAGAAPRR